VNILDGRGKKVKFTCIVLLFWLLRLREIPPERCSQ